MAVTVRPRREFYEIFSREQIIDIVRSIDIYKDVPIEYSYFNEGAHIWDAYAKRLYGEGTPNSINTSEELIQKNIGYIMSILHDKAAVDVIDITVGNLLPAKWLVSCLYNSGKLGNYTALDKSPDILKIAESNMEAWFGDNINFQGEIFDVNRDRFSHLSMKKWAKDNSLPNLVLYLGATSQNFRDMKDSFQNINESMGPDDILIHTLKLDSATSRTYFDFDPEPQGKIFSSSVLAPRHRYVLDLMDLASLGLINIPESLYEVEREFDPNLGQRTIRVRFLQDITIQFEIDHTQYPVAIKQGESLMLLRVWHQSYQDVLRLLDETGFKTMHFSHTENREYLLTISRVKRDL